MDLYQEAVEKFRWLFAEARKCGHCEPTAMSLATVDERGRPTVRTVLLRSFDARGFVFFTNRQSRKARHLERNPSAALCLYWFALEHQVTVEGTIEVLEAAEADGFWSSRSRDSQLTAWASAQSESLESREALTRRIAEYRDRFDGQRVPRPPHWQGYRLVPDRIEFWKSDWHRAQERVCYERTGEGWARRLLYP